MDKIKASQFADLAYYCRFKPPSRLITFAAPASTLTNFPALVKSNSTFHIGTSTGYDVHFQDLAGNELYYDLDFYDPVTGNGAWWVQIPSLSSSAPTSIKMLYGDSSASTNGSTPSTVWSGYNYVYHFNDVNDLSSVVGSYTPTNSGSVSATLTLVSNQMTGRGMQFEIASGYGSTNYNLLIANGINTRTGTISILATADSIPPYPHIVDLNTGWTSWRFYLFNGTFTFNAAGVSMSMTQADANGFYCYGGSTNNSPVGVACSVNGIIRDVSSGTNSMRWDVPAMKSTGGGQSGGVPIPSTKIVLDEIRISANSYRSAEWLQYEQNLMMDHSSYVTYGSET